MRTQDEIAEKTNVGFEPAYRTRAHLMKQTEGLGQNPKDRGVCLKQFKKNYGKIDWSKK